MELRSENLSITQRVIHQLSDASDQTYISFLNTIFAGNLIIPDWLSFATECEKIYNELLEMDEGNVSEL